MVLDKLRQHHNRFKQNEWRMSDELKQKHISVVERDFPTEFNPNVFGCYDLWKFPRKNG